MGRASMGLRASGILTAWAPRRASSIAIATPIPREAPVTRAVLPLRVQGLDMMRMMRQVDVQRESLYRLRGTVKQLGR